jgi:hypothetical protein
LSKLVPLVATKNFSLADVISVIENPYEQFPHPSTAMSACSARSQIVEERAEP